MELSWETIEEISQDMILIDVGSKLTPQNNHRFMLLKIILKKFAKNNTLSSSLISMGIAESTFVKLFRLGSFFYGNNIGKSPMLFPFIASKANTNIIFEDSKFST